MAFQFWTALALLSAAAPDEPSVRLEPRPNQILLEIGGVDVAEYVFDDPDVPRPYFANVRTLGGIRVSRCHPPAEDEAQDHVGLHTGIWLAFGDLSGEDFWRLKARVEHAGFVDPPQADGRIGRWTVRNRYRSADGARVVCEEVCRCELQVRSDGWLLSLDSEFSNPDGEFFFGEQDEMGLGIRVAGPLAVKSKQGGRIVDSEGRVNEAQIWGRNADWVDYGGLAEGRRIGMALLSHPQNPNPSWHHARDYGFVAANFIPRSDGKGRIVVPRGRLFRLRYAVLVYETTQDAQPDVAGCFQSFAETPQRR